MNIASEDTLIIVETMFRLWLWKLDFLWWIAKFIEFSKVKLVQIIWFEYLFLMYVVWNVLSHILENEITYVLILRLSFWVKFLPKIEFFWISCSQTLLDSFEKWLVDVVVLSLFVLFSFLNWKMEISEEIFLYIASKNDNMKCEDHDPIHCIDDV